MSDVRYTREDMRKMFDAGFNRVTNREQLFNVCIDSIVAPPLLVKNEKLREENEKFKKALEEIVAMSNKFSAIHLKAASAIYD